MIVCADANIERAANAAAFYSMNNGGQVCISVERVLRRGAGLRRVRRQGDRQRPQACARACPTGVGTVDVGAVTFPPQLEIVDDHVRDAVEQGRQGPDRRPSRPGRGPLLRADGARRRRPLDEAACTEETFGPTLPIMKIADAEEGVRLANDSDYGLQASVWTERRRARRGARAPDRGRRRVRQRRPGQLHGAEPADGRLEDLRAGHAPRRQRDPQVHARSSRCW